ncbi:MAG: DNA repair protein RadA, partial [Clostridia bacterium]|nr:DNA repair protein RadA [Clostridia bacterium]
MAKTNSTIYECSACGATSPRWMGKCPACGQFNTMVEEAVKPAANTADKARKSLYSHPSAKPLSQITYERHDRTPSGITEFDTVLGGGIVAGSLVLLGGDPGIGKSTLLTQIAAH